MWSAIRRGTDAEDEIAASDAIVDHCATGAIDISRFCFPAGIPKGCHLICSRFETPIPSIVKVTLQLIATPGTISDGCYAFRAAILQPQPFGNGAIDEHPRIYRSRGTSTLRVVVPKRHAKHSAGAWDIEIFSPGCIEPTARLTLDQWSDYYRDRLSILQRNLVAPEDDGVETHGVILREWEHSVKVGIERRTQKCHGKSHVVEIITASAALHEWEASSKVLIKADAPLVPVSIIGVVK